MAEDIAEVAVSVVAHTDKLQKGFRKARFEARELEQTGFRQLEARTIVLRRRFDEARMASGGLATGLSGIARWGKLALAALAVGTIYKIGAGISEASDSIDKLSKTSAKLGVRIEQMQELGFAAEQSGVSVETFSMAMQRMTRRAAEAAIGTGEAKGALAELRIDAEKFNRLELGDKMTVLADAFKRIPSESDKVRLAFKLFDSEGVALVNMLSAGSDGIRELMLQQRMAGVVTQQQASSVEAANDSYNRLTKSWSNLTNQIAAGTAAFRDESYNFIRFWTELAQGKTPMQDVMDQMKQASDEASSGVLLAPTNSAMEARQKRVSEYYKMVREAQKRATMDATKLRDQLALDTRFLSGDITPVEFQLKQLRASGVREELLDEIRLWNERLKQQEKLKKLEEEERHKSKEMIAAAKRLGQERLTPLQEYTNNVVDLLSIEKAGQLSAEESRFARRNLMDDMLANIRRQLGAGNIGVAGSLSANIEGSSGAFAAIDRQRGQQRAQQQLLDTQKQAFRQLQQINQGIQRQINAGQLQVKKVTI